MKHVLLLAISITIAFALHAQSVSSSVVNTSGGSFTQGHLALDWSIGEAALVETMVAPSGKAVLTHGLLQPNTMLTNTGQSFTPEEVKILPNPTFNVVEINFLTSQQGTIDIYIFDAQGKNIMSRKAYTSGIGLIEKINLSAFSAGAYIIRVDLNPSAGSVRKTGSYKIIKY